MKIDLLDIIGILAGIPMVIMLWLFMFSCVKEIFDRFK